MQKNESRPLFYNIHKRQFKGIKHLNIRPEAIKILEENTGNMLFDNCLSSMFLDMSPKEREVKAKINGTTSH